MTFKLFASGALAIALCLASPAFAQPFAGGGRPGAMPNLRMISGKPLPDAGMAAGTVSVRLARKTLQNPAAGLEVVAITKNAGGDARKRTGKTDDGGRVLFEGLAVGDEFHAEVKVDGELVKTDTFTIPAQGGVRTMLIAGLGAAPAGGEPEAPAAAPAAGGAESSFALGSTTGSAKPEASLAKGVLEVKVVDEGGRAVPGQPITLGAVDQTNKVTTRHATTDGQGVARFEALPMGKTTGYAAVTDWRGMHIGTEPFAMPEDSGARAEIHALARTNDPSVITIGEGARIVLRMREDTLQVLEMLPLENKSDKMFDPGPGAIEIPLPQGFTGADAGQSERKIEVRQNHGVAIHGTISPKGALGGADAKSAGNEVQFGFVMPYEGDSKEIVQAMPTGIGLFTLIVEQIPGLEVTGPGIGAREQRELGGVKYWVMPGQAIAPGGTLRLSVVGLPSLDHTGRAVAAALTLGLLALALIFGRRPLDSARRAAAGERERLTARRETLFAELVAVEKQARDGKANTERRTELVSKLEGVYQQLAALDEQRAPSS